MSNEKQTAEEYLKSFTCELDSDDIREYGRICVEEYKESLRSEEAEDYFENNLAIPYELTHNELNNGVFEVFNKSIEINTQHMIDKAVDAFDRVIGFYNIPSLNMSENEATEKFKNIMEGKG